MMPELEYGKDLFLPLVVIRRITPEGAVLERVRLMSQRGDWNAQWELYYLLGRACDEFGDISFQNPGDPFGLPNDPEDESEKVLVTNAYRLKLAGKEADLFRGLIDLLEMTYPGDFTNWLAKLARLEIVESSCTPVQSMVESLLQQAVTLHIPKVIPLGKSENEVAKQKQARQPT